MAVLTGTTRLANKAPFGFGPNLNGFTVGDLGLTLVRLHAKLSIESVDDDFVVISQVEPSNDQEISQPPWQRPRPPKCLIAIHDAGRSTVQGWYPLNTLAQSSTTWQVVEGAANCALVAVAAAGALCPAQLASASAAATFSRKQGSI